MRKQTKFFQVTKMISLQLSFGNNALLDIEWTVSEGKLYFISFDFLKCSIFIAFQGENLPF